MKTECWTVDIFIKLSHIKWLPTNFTKITKVYIFNFFNITLLLKSFVEKLPFFQGCSSKKKNFTISIKTMRVITMCK